MTIESTGELPSVSPAIPPSEIEPLFARATTRALLGAAAATWRNDGELAVPAIIDALARRQGLRQFPRREVPTLRVGMMLLLSRHGLEPFAPDVIDLRTQLRRVVGVTAVTECWLDVDGRKVSPRLRATVAWPPMPGTPVVVVTSNAEVLGPLASELAARDCPVIAIVPGRGAPPAIPHVATIAWDHRTRVADVLRSRRKAERA